MEIILLWRFSLNDFAMENHKKLFYYSIELEIILLKESIGNGHASET